MNAREFPATAEGMYQRFRAFVERQSPVHRPEAEANPFPGQKGVPSATAADLDAQLLGGSLRHHGCLLVPGLFDEDAVGRLRHATSAALDHAQHFLARRETSEWFMPFPTVPSSILPAARKFGLKGGSVFAADSPRAFDVLLGEFRRVGISALIEEFLGEEVYLSVGKTSLRRVDPGIATGWHQDGAFLGEQTRTVNVWIALSDCGEDAPGLDLLPRRVDQLCERGTHGAHFDWSIGDPVVQSLAQEMETPVISPRFRAGDALLFDQLFVHRTGIREGMTRARYAIEAWHFAGSTFPHAQIPIALGEQNATAQAGGGA